MYPSNGSLLEEMAYTRAKLALVPNDTDAEQDELRRLMDQLVERMAVTDQERAQILDDCERRAFIRLYARDLKPEYAKAAVARRV